MRTGGKALTKTRTLLYLRQRTLYKKIPVVEMTHHKFIYRSCTRGPCPDSYTLGTGWHSPPAGTALGVLSPGWGMVQWLAASLSTDGRGGWAQASRLSCGSQAGNCLAFPSVGSSQHPGSLGGASLPSSMSTHMTLDPFQLRSHNALFKSPRLTACFFGLRAGMAGEGLSPLLCPSL